MLNLSAEGNKKFNLKMFCLMNIVWILLGISLVVMGLLSKNFFRVTILSNILTQAAALGILTLAQSQVLMIGEIDLSMVGVMGLGAGLGTRLMVSDGLPWYLAILLIISFGTLIGFINGLLVVKLRATSLIETLAMGLMLQGGLMVLTMGQTIVNFPTEFIWLGKISIGDFYLLCIPFFAIFIIIWYIWNKTTHGRSLYAVGGNARAARVSGINVDKIRILAFTSSGLLTGIAAYILACYICAVTMTFGEGLDMYTLAAAVIGGVSLKGGRGRLSGVMGGILLITLMKVGMVTMAISSYFTDLFCGAMIFIAVIFDSIRNKAMKY